MSDQNTQSSTPSNAPLTSAEKAVVLLKEMNVELNQFTEQKDQLDMLRAKVQTLTNEELQALKEKVGNVKKF